MSEEFHQHKQQKYNIVLLQAAHNEKISNIITMHNTFKGLKNLLTV